MLDSKFNLSELIKNYLTLADERVIAARKRVMQSAAIYNDDIEPTVDCYGRLHAPCDNYQWLDNSYAGGSYLPYPMEFWEMLEEQLGFMPSKRDYSKVGLIKSRVLLPLSEAEEIINITTDRAKFSKGKDWEKEGEKFCYLYIETKYKGLDNIIIDFKQSRNEELKAKRLAEKEAAKLLKGDSPEGRVEITGKILTAKLVNRPSFSYYDDGLDWKILVELENKSTVWGTLPSKISDAKEGDIIRFTATFTKEKDDNTHSFYKRPSKAVILNKKEL